MRTSSDRILTSHAGSLPRPDDLIEAYRTRGAGEVTDEHAFAEKLKSAVADVVRRQKDVGVDIPGDGEFGKPMAQRVNYGSWLRYSWNRLGGLDPNGPGLYEIIAARIFSNAGTSISLCATIVPPGTRSDTSSGRSLSLFDS